MHGDHVLIVDDILTTGSSVRDTVDAVAKLGGIVVGIGVLVDRSDQNLEFDLPFFSCHRAPTLVYSPQECPLCANHVPLVKPGAAR
jgi:orotate phosphoribosyltransferase